MLLGDDAYRAVIEPEIVDFVSPEFKRLCQSALPGLYPDKTFLDIGRWWYKEHEVDVVGFAVDGTNVVGECKVTNAPLDYSELASLETRAEEIRWSPDSGGDGTIEYALFARNGATQSVQEAVSDRNDVQLFGLNDVTRHATEPTFSFQINLDFSVVTSSHSRAVLTEHHGEF